MDIDLTNAEKEILILLTKENLTAKQIQIRRNCTKQAYYKIERSLRKKGAYNRGLLGNFLIDRSNKPVNRLRLHAEHYVIKIISVSDSYKKKRELCNQITLDGNTIKLWERKIEVYANLSFYGDSLSEVFHESQEYWNRFFHRLEHELKLILIKDRVANIYMAKCHIAETRNEIAKELDNTGERFLQIRAEDGKVCFIVDNSFNWLEFEAVHPKTAPQDMEKVRDVFLDLRNKESYLPSDSKELIDKLALISNNLLEVNVGYKPMFEEMNQNIMKFAQAMQFYGEHFKSHAGLIKEGTQMFKKINKKMEQKKLRDFQ